MDHSLICRLLALMKNSFLTWSFLMAAQCALCQPWDSTVQQWLDKGRSAQVANYDTSLHYYHLALTEGERIGDEKLKAVVKARVAGVYASMGKHDVAKTNYLQILKDYPSSEYDAQRMAAMSRLGMMYRQDGLLDSAMYWFKELERLEQESSVAPSPISSYGLIYSVLTMLHADSLAETYLKKEWERAAQSGNKVAQSISLYDQIHFYKKKERWADLDSAMTLYREIMDFNQFDGQSLLIHLEGLFTGSDGSVDIKNLKQLIVGLKKLNLSENLILSYALLGDAHVKEKEFAAAIPHLEKSIRLADSMGLDGMKLFPLSSLTEAFEKTGDFQSALSTEKEYSAISGIVLNQESRIRIDELNVRYETAQKEKELLANQILLRRKTNERNLWLAFSIVVLVSGISALYLLRIKYKKDQQISAQNALIQQQKIEALKNENKILAMDAMINGQEEERKRIAKDLHDGLGGILSTVKLRFENIQHEIDRLQAFQPYAKAIGMLDNACEEVRRISHDMMPGVLTVGGLPDAIRDLGETLQHDHGLQTDVQIMGMEKRLDQNKEIMLYRIAQELTTNVIRHAGATNAIIQLVRHDDEVMLTVEDNGAGFMVENQSAGLGLKSIRSRVEYLNGELDIDSQPGEGTTVSIRIAA